MMPIDPTNLMPEKGKNDLYQWFLDNKKIGGLRIGIALGGYYLWAAIYESYSGIIDQWVLIHLNMIVVISIVLLLVIVVVVVYITLLKDLLGGIHKYKLYYNIINHGTNKEAHSFVRQLTQELKRIGKTFNTEIYIERSEKCPDGDRKKVFLKGEVNEQLQSLGEKINKGEFEITFAGNEYDKKECTISEKNAINDINKFKSNYIFFVNRVFAALSSIDGNYRLSEKIASNYDGQEKDTLRLDIHYHKLNDDNVSQEEKKKICKLYIDKKGIPKFIVGYYTVALYKTGDLTEAERIVDIFKPIDPNNPIRYINKAFLLLSKGKEKAAFEEYQKLRSKFSRETVMKVDLKKVIAFIDDERRKNGNPYFDLGIMYLKYYYLEENIDSVMLENYLGITKTKTITKRLKEVKNSSI